MIFLAVKERIGRFWIVLAVLCGISASAFAQNTPVYQTGSITRGHAAMWQAPGVQGDAGGPANGALTGVGVTNTGLPSCINDAPTSSSTGYHQLCLGANATVGSTGPPSGGGGGSAVGPSVSRIGDCTVWGNAVGTLLGDGFGICPISPKYLGAAGNGTANDTIYVQNAINLAQSLGASVWLGDGIYGVSATLTDNGKPVLIEGNGQGPGYHGNSCPISGLRLLVPNLSPTISLSGSGSILDRVCMDHGSVINSSGVMVSVSAANSIQVINNTIIGGCGGIDISGSSTTQAVGTIADYNSILPIDGTGCFGVRVGHNSTNGFTTDSHIDHNEIYCPGAPVSVVGMELEDVGGAAIVGNNIVPCAWGTRIYPGANQLVQGLFFGESVLGDTSTNNDLFIDAGSSTALIRSITIENSWMASAFGTSVLIQDTPNAIIASVHIVGSHVYPRNGQVGVFINGNAGTSSGLSDITLDDSAICVANAGSSLQAVITDIGGFSAVRNNSIGVCNGPDTTPDSGTGLSIAPSGEATSGVFTGNLIHSMATALAFGGSANTSNVVIDNNGVLDSQMPSVASAVTVTSINSRFIMSGTATVSTLLPAWTGREVTIVPTGTWSTTTGGNIGTVGTAAAGIVVTGIYSGTNWNFHF